MGTLKKFVVVAHSNGLTPTVHQGGTTRAEANIEAAHLASKVAKLYESKMVRKKDGTWRVQTPMGVLTIEVGRNIEHGFHKPSPKPPQSG